MSNNWIGLDIETLLKEEKRSARARTDCVGVLAIVVVIVGCWIWFGAQTLDMFRGKSCAQIVGCSDTTAVQLSRDSGRR